MRPAFIGAGVFSGIINVLGFTGPLFMLEVYDRVIPSGSLPTLVALLILVAGFCREPPVWWTPFYRNGCSVSLPVPP
jgi:ABC-type protease/lipase transport system fused ATPase/permease subunit